MRSMTGGSVPAAGRGWWTWVIGAGLAAWLVAAGSTNLPLREFDRLRRYDRTGTLLPNWRFFAPEPAQHDVHLLHRVLTAEGDQTPWREASRIAPHGWLQMVWYPGRRRDKALFDIVGELTAAAGPTRRDVSHTHPYRLLRDFVELTVREEYAGEALPQGFQFIVAQHAGYDEGLAPDYIFASPFVPMRRT